MMQDARADSKMRSERRWLISIGTAAQQIERVCRVVAVAVDVYADLDAGRFLKPQVRVAAHVERIAEDGEIVSESEYRAWLESQNNNQA